MTTTETPLADRFTTVILSDRDIVVTVERTDCPHLGIGPVISKDGITDAICLLHLPTGTYLPQTLEMVLGGGETLRKLAAEVAGLDWDFIDLHGCPKATVEGYLAARRALETASGERIFQEYPQGWGAGPDPIPGDAAAMVAWLLDGWQATEDQMFNADNPDKLESSLPDGSPNPWWAMLSTRKVDVFGLAYLLAALQRVSPAVADHAAAFLAGQWAAGDSLGEWVWQWRHEIEQGEPLKLPAVPSPEPPDGQFLS